METYIHPTALVDPDALIGEGTKVFAYAQIRNDVRIGAHCLVGFGVEVAAHARIGDCVKLVTHSHVATGAVLEDGVFIGPGVHMANVKYPRAMTPEGQLTSGAMIETAPVRIKRGASLGVGAVVAPGVTIGEWAVIGAGAAVVKDIPAFAIAVGVPARVVGMACLCGRPVHRGEYRPDLVEELRRRCLHRRSE